MTRTTWLLVLLALAAAAPAGEAPERMLQRAGQLEDQGKLSQAAEVYRDFLKANAEHSQAPEAHYRLAKCLDGLGLVDEAARHLEAATAGGPKRWRHRADAMYMLGKLYGSLKKYDSATKVLEQLLAEGADLYEDEVLSLCGGYYAVQKKYDEAAAKFNILKRRKGSRFAERAAYRLAILWLQAEKLELAVEAVEDLAAQFPQNPQARGLMVQVAELFRKKGQPDKAIAVCAQLQARFGRSHEAQVAGYVVGLCYRDRKQYDKATAAFEAVARVPENRTSGLGAEALLQSADICYSDLAQPDKAMPRYEEAAKMAREANGERQARILEQCYFRLAEHHFTRKEWSVALEYYVLLRRVGTEVNVLPRILQCQAQLQTDQDVSLTSPGDVEYIRKKIQENAGTYAAAEAEVYLLDRKLAQALGRKGGFGEVLAEYQGLLKRYPKDVLAQQSLESYVYLQMGICCGSGEAPADLAKAAAMLEKALELDPATPYKTDILENLARVADAAGDKRKSFEVYKRLFESASQRLEKGEDTQALRERTAEYIRSMLARAEQKDSLAEALAVARRIMDKKGPFSDAARHAMFYMAELYYLKKDYSAAAATYKQFVRAYGPKLDANDEVTNPPWKPPGTDDKVKQVYDAAVRIAHCWYMQGHTQNMVQAYQWMVRNLSYSNKHVAEAQYWLALELGKGNQGRTPANRRKMAEMLWKNVVNPSFDFESRDFAKSFHFWVSDDETARYVKAAILKSGQIFSDLKEHELAAGIFAEYLDLYPVLNRRRKGRQGREDRGLQKPDDMYSIARYALGREYVALGDIPAVVECYRPYVEQMRDDRFRVSGLRLLGYHAGKAGLTEAAVEAYATLLDEYGPVELDSRGQPVPVPVKDRVRPGKYRWDGVRTGPPKGLDLGEVRFSLGYLYWKNEDWANCIRTLLPFVQDPRLFENRSRPQALYMAAQSYYHVHEYDKGVAIIRKLIHDHPKFQAIEEAHVYAARGCVETGQWSQVEGLYEKFLDAWPRSAFRPHMDLYAAVATLGGGQTEQGRGRLKSIAESDTYSDVKAAAHYHLGLHLMGKPADYKAAAEHLDKSVALYPRETSCLAAAKCHVKLKDWPKARDLLEQALRSFPKGSPQALQEAKDLLGQVLKEIARQ